MTKTASKQILVVDDDDMNREILEAFLSLEDYSVVLAHNGADGLHKAAELRPDLIILDVRMPDISGYEVCQQLKSQPETAHIPVLLVTGLDETEDREQGLQAGAAAFLPRPFDSADLLSQVSVLLN